MIHSTVLPRPDLTKKILQTILSCGLTAITAPMGYGKTTLARALGASPKAGYWHYAVPAGPHDAHFLWHDMCESFTAQGMPGIRALQKIGFPQTASQMRRVSTHLRTLDTPALLLLDDYHLVTDPAMNHFWESVVRMEIPGLHVVLLSRTRPGMSLEELRIKRLAAVFEQDTLAFSEDETKEYFRLNGIDDPGTAENAWRYSEGWPAALWLYLQGKKRNNSFDAASDIESLLENTVFSAYDEAEKELLMRLSVFEDFTGREAERIAGQEGSALHLRRLRNKNAFLSFDPEIGRYKFHGIFRDFLRKELAVASAIDHSALYRCAGECCEERGKYVLAFRFYLQAGRDEDLSHLLNLFPRFSEDTSAAYFSEEIFAKTHALSKHIRLRNPIGYLSFVIGACLMWNDHRTASLLDEAEDMFTAAPDIPSYLKQRLLGEIESLRGTLNYTDMKKVWEHFAVAHRLLNSPSIIHSQATATNFGNPSVAFTFLREPGEYAALVKNMEENLHLYHALSNGLGQRLDKVFRAEYLLDRNQLASAETVLQETLRAVTGIEEDTQISIFLSATLHLARVYTASGRQEEAARLVDGLPARVEHLILEHRECADMAAGYINAVLGRLDAIPQWLREGEIFDPPHRYLPQVFGLSFTVYAKSLMQQERYHDLAEAISRRPASLSSSENLLVAIHDAVHRSVVAWHTQGRNAALACMRKAMELSRPDGIVLPLAEYGGAILPLLRFFGKQADRDNAHFTAVLTQTSRMVQVTRRTAVEKNTSLLTPREQELMRYAAQGQSNRVIAENVGVSIDGVKKVLSRAYAKLEASGRVEAVRRFSEIYGAGD